MVTMDTNEFAIRVRREKDRLLSTYLDPHSGSHVGQLLQRAEKTEAGMTELADSILTDAFYTMLLALDGSASLDGIQQRYFLRTEDGVELTGDGKLEAAAWTAFYGD